MFLHVKQEITAVAHRIEVAPPEQTFQRRILLRRVDMLSKIANRTRGGWQLLLPDDFTRDIDAGARPFAVETQLQSSTWTQQQRQRPQPSLSVTHRHQYPH